MRSKTALLRAPDARWPAWLPLAGAVAQAQAQDRRRQRRGCCRKRRRRRPRRQRSRTSSRRAGASSRTQQKDLKAREDKLQKDGAVMAENERRNAEKALRDGQRELARKQNEFLEDLNVRRNEALGQLQRTVCRKSRPTRRAPASTSSSPDALYASPVARHHHAGADRTAGARARPPRPREALSAATGPRQTACPRLAELAVRFGCELRGDPDVVVDACRRRCRTRRAGCSGVSGQPALPAASGDHARVGGRARCAVRGRCARSRRSCIANPYATYARIAPLLHPAPPASPPACIRQPSSSPVRASIHRPGSAPAASIGAGCAHRRAVRSSARGACSLDDVERRRRHALVAKSHAVPRRARSAQRCLLHPGSRDRRRRLRPRARRRAATSRCRSSAVCDRRRRRDRRQHDDRSRRDRRHRHRGRRQDRQPGPDRAQRAHRRAHGDRRLRRHLRQHDDRQALHDRRQVGIAGHI